MSRRPATTGTRRHTGFLDDAAPSKERMVVLLYERVISDLDDAVVGIVARDRHRAHLDLLHAQDIIAELDLALDPDTWPAATRMSSVYQFLLERLTRANIDQDELIVRECRAIVAELAGAWRQAWQDVSTTRTAVGSTSSPLGSAPYSAPTRSGVDVQG